MSETTATSSRPRRVSRFGPALPPRTFAGFAAAIATVLLIAFFGYHLLDDQEESTALTTHTLQVFQRVDALLSSLKDAETGQRGYLLTNRESYLDPYNDARANIPGQLQELRRLTANSPRRQEQLGQIQRYVEDKLAELQQTIDLQRAGNPQAARDLILTDRGKLMMDRARDLVQQFLDQDRQELTARFEAARKAAELTVIATAGGASVLFVLILVAGFLASRDFMTQQIEAWLQAGETGLAQLVQGEQRLDVLGENVLSFLAGYLDAQVGAIYITEAGGWLRRF